MEILGNKKALGLLTIAGLLLVASIYAIALPFKQAENIIYWLWVLILLALTANALAWSSLFPYSKKTFAAVAAATAVSVVVFFPWNWIQIFSALVMVTGLYLARRSIMRAEKESLHFSYYRSVRNGQMAFLAAVSLVLAFNFYLQTSVNLKNDPDGFYRRMSGSVVRSVEPILQSRIQGFSPNQTLDEFLAASRFFDDNLEESICSRAGIGEFCPELSLLQKRESFLTTFGVEAEGDEQVMEILARIVSVRIQEFFAPVQAFVPFIYALLLFLSLRFVMLAVSFIAAASGALIFKLALRLNFVRLAEKNVAVEVPELT